MRGLLLPVLVVLLSAGAQAQSSSPCAALSPQTLEHLTAIHGMQPTVHASAQGAQRTCTWYWRNAPAAAGRDGTNPGADLVLQLIHFPTVAAAQARLDQRGMTVPSEVLTDSPLGTDSVGDLEHLLVAGSDEYLVMRGAAARHGADVAILGMSDGFSEDSASNAELQAVALTAAGAHVVPVLRQDVCALVPAASLQTLVSLRKSSILVADRTFANQTNACIWRMEAEDADPDSPVFLTLTLRRYLTAAEALTAFGKKADPRPIPHTADPDDKAASHRGSSPGAIAVHGSQLATFTLSSAAADAANAPGYNYRLERVALTAAGASFPADPAAPKVTAPIPFTTTQTLQHKASALWEEYTWVFFLGAIMVLLAIHFYRRRQLRLYGMPGTAIVNSVSDTAITINNNPRVRLHMTITPESGDPYQGTIGMVVSRLNPSGLVGQRVNVRIDRNKPSRFMIVS